MTKIHQITLTLLSFLIIHSCGENTTNDDTVNPQQTIDNKTIEPEILNENTPLEIDSQKIETENKETSTDEMEHGLIEIKKLINLLSEKKILLMKTNQEKLTKIYPISSSDEYGNFKIEKSFSELGYKILMNFSISESVLEYISFECKLLNKSKISSNTSNKEILNFLTSKLGKSTILSEDYKDRNDWYKEDYNVVFFNNQEWVLNIESKDFNPGF